MKGGGWQYANLQSYAYDSLKEPDSYYPQNLPGDEFRKSVSMTNPGMDILNLKNPKIKFAWIERANPMTQNPNTNKVKEALAEIPFKVVVDQFLTDTAKEANIVLPAKSMFEQTDIIGSYWNPYVQLKPKVLECPGEVKTELEIYNLLAIEMGYSNQEIKESGLIDWKENSIREYLKDIVEFDGGINWEDLEKGPQLHPTFEEIAFENKTFNTKSGKIELLSTEAHDIWKVNPLPEYTTVNKEDENTFQMLTPNEKYRIHSQFHNLDIVSSVAESQSLQMHPLDAIEIGAKNGDTVEVSNERGKFSIKISYSLSIKRNCVSVPNGCWNNGDGQVNNTSPGLFTDMGYGTAFHDNFVNIKLVTDEN